MKVQVLLSCMNQKDHAIVTRANLQTDAIIVNQSDAFEKDVFYHDGSKIVFMSFDEKGVGLSRNNALMRATGDIVLFADEDMAYVDNYENIVLEEFRKNPQADMIVFNVPSTNSARKSAEIKVPGRVRWYSSLKYGTVRMAVRTERLKKKNIFFSLLFGGGATYSSGEDSKFIFQAIQSGLRVYAVPRVIGYVAQEESSWFNGYDRKYFVDKGVLYRSLSPKFHAVFSLRFIWRRRNVFTKHYSFLKLLKFMIVSSKNE